jgi:hypothetical protein
VGVSDAEGPDAEGLDLKRVWTYGVSLSSYLASPLALEVGTSYSIICTSELSNALPLAGSQSSVGAYLAYILMNFLMTAQRA